MGLVLKAPTSRQIHGSYYDVVPLVACRETATESKLTCMVPTIAEYTFSLKPVTASALRVLKIGTA